MSDTPAYLNADLDPLERAADLVGRMTLAEKCSQVLHDAPAVDRLDVPKYNWWNECLHGVARAGVATVFPQAIGLAAIWSEGYMHRVAEIISEEARAKHHEALRHDDRGYYKGLTFWSPNVNIFRDPRWGRGHETYGECPYLTARLGVAFIKGLQGDDPKYLKSAACAKHYVVHSGPEADRHKFDAICNVKDLRETYLPAFAACVREGKVESVMGAYNRTNGEPCCGSQTLLADILREEWGFHGHVVSDCWAIKDFHTDHKVTKNAVESAALAANMGCDLNCGCVYEDLQAAVEQGLVEESVIDTNLTRLMAARFRLGMFDDPAQVPFSSIPHSVNDCEEHAEMARDAARKSMVLLKNDGLLPLDPNSGQKVAVIGPNAHDIDVIKGNYFGLPSKPVTFLDGIRERIGADNVVYSQGCRVTWGDWDFLSGYDNISEAVTMAEQSDVAVLVMGLNSQVEGEQGDAGNSEAAGDKVHLNLTGKQQELVERVHATGKPVVLVLVVGSALAVTWAEENVPAIIQAWYPGQAAGSALADILFGDVSPAGRMPVSVPRSLDDLPDFTDYNMDGRTYRFDKGDTLFPFGYGLSYTNFTYSDISLSAHEVAASAEAEVTVTATVTNSGERDGDEVVQCYVRDEAATTRVANHELRGFKRIHLKAGTSEEVSFTLNAADLSLITDAGERVLEAGAFKIFVGGGQPDARTAALTGKEVGSADLSITGESCALPYWK